jgi:DNA-binding response OmpR family regulator
MSEGYEVETAGDGIEALEQLEDADFALVILDLEMPRMDGRTLFRELRARGFDQPVIIVSAFGAAQARRELGADSAVSKPFDPDRLVTEVRELLKVS